MIAWGKMGPDHRVDLSDDDQKNLSFRLFREWWILVVDSLVGAVGSGVALKMLKPYYVNSSRAAGLQFEMLTGAPFTTAGDVAAAWIGIANRMVSEGRVSIFADTDDYASSVVN